MKTIFFVETMADHEACLRYLRRHAGAVSDLLIVNLNPTNRLDYSGLPVAAKTENDYLTAGMVAGINEKALGLAATWFEDHALRELLEIDGINLGLVMENFLMRDIISTFKYLRLLPEILRQESCNRVILVEQTARRLERKALTPSPEEKIANGILGVMQQRYPLFLERLPAVEERKDRACAADVFQGMVQPVADRLRVAANALLSLRANMGKQAACTVAMTGAPRLLFPLMQEFLGDARTRLIYFQNQCGPRMAPQLFSRGVRYAVSKDYALPGESSRRRDLGADLSRRWAHLARHERFRELFTFEGHAAGQALLPVFQQAFEDYFPRLLIEIARYKHFLSRECVKAVVVDEAVKEYNRPLCLAARALGIPSMELQHGVPCRYQFHRVATDKVAVWGDYFRERLMREGGFPAASMAVTGSPSLDALAKRDRHADQAFVRRRLRIPGGRSIVTFAATPFHLGSRGGVLGEHLTREQVESALSEIILSLSDRTDVHLIVKVHPGDPREQDVDDFVRRSGYRRPYHVVKAFDVHALLNASELVFSLGSTTILEAIVMKVPVLYLNFLGCPEINPYAEWNALTEIRDPRDLAKAVSTTLKNRQAYVRRTESGRARVLREFACDADGFAARRCRDVIAVLMQAAPHDDVNHSAKVIPAV